MGMSASQARFLGLTAQKSDVEYQAQQINQQRVALADESAGWTRKLSNLTVPIPPDATNYYSMAYTYTDPTTEESMSIVDYRAGSNNTYDITVRKIVSAGNVYVAVPNGSVLSLDSGGDYTLLMSGETAPYTLEPSDTDANGKQISPPIYTYKVGDKQYFLDTAENLNKKLDATTKSMTVDATHPLSSYYYQNVSVTNDDIKGVTFTTSAKGRFDTMTYTDKNDTKQTLALEVEKVEDSTGYEAAMQDYNYEVMMYDKAVAEINAQTSDIQQDDKSLELNLKELDTKRNALQTELDAVKEVIKKNVESSYKTFSG